MRSSVFVSAFTAAERRFVALTRSAELPVEVPAAVPAAVPAEASEGGLVDFSSEAGPDPLADPLWGFSGTACVFLLMFDWRAARFASNAAAADSASCLACRKCFVLSCSSDHRR